MKSSWLAALVLGICLTPAQAAIYRWVDAQGQVHFGDQPGANHDAKPLRTPGTPPKAPPETTGREDDSEAEAVSSASVRQHKCTQAQQRLKRYQQADTLKVRGADGKERTLTPDEQIQAIVNMQKSVEAFCGDSATGYDGRGDENNTGGGASNEAGGTSNY